jgi:hypothetical protein
VQIVCVRERSSLANNNNVACTVAKEHDEQIVNAKRESNAAAEEASQIFLLPDNFGWVRS